MLSECLSVFPIVCLFVCHTRVTLKQFKIYRNTLHAIRYRDVPSSLMPFRNHAFRDLPQTSVLQHPSLLLTAKIRPIIRHISEMVQDRRIGGELPFTYRKKAHRSLTGFLPTLNDLEQHNRHYFASFRRIW